MSPPASAPGLRALKQTPLSRRQRGYCSCAGYSEGTAGTSLLQDARKEQGRAAVASAELDEEARLQRKKDLLVPETARCAAWDWGPIAACKVPAQMWKG